MDEVGGGFDDRLSPGAPAFLHGCFGIDLILRKEHMMAHPRARKLGGAALACSVLGWAVALANLAVLSHADQAHFFDSTGFPDRILNYFPASAPAILLSLPLLLLALMCCLFVY